MFYLTVIVSLSLIVSSVAQSVQGCAAGQIGVGVDATVDFSVCPIMLVLHFDLLLS